ncbi:hypothetical protein GCM10009717_23500 [Agromyces allii]|uniref:Uncharacterized protein n=1 Tax=Agromyces allii TaxID=393607 RepID=A0ABN2QR01_9MICO
MSLFVFPPVSPAPKIGRAVQRFDASHRRPEYAGSGGQGTSSTPMPVLTELRR